MTRTGVPVRGFTRETRRGSSPSRPMAKVIRDWPKSSVSTTLVIATSAPNEMMSAPHSKPAPSLSAVASGASAPPSWSTGSAPVATTATAM